MKRILVTGGYGFIGSNLVTKCLNMGWTVSAVDDMSNGHREFLPRVFLNTVYDWAHQDFTSNAVIREISMQRFDAVIHLAAIPRVSYSVEHPLSTNDVNVTRTLRLMDACRGNVEKFVFASSSSVYGGADMLPTPETSPKKPKSPYALQKSIIEDYLDLYYDLYDLNSISLRFFNVFGKNCLGDSPYSTALGAWLYAIRHNLPMRSDGNGWQTRDMCHVDNVVHACCLAADSSLTGSHRFNIANGSSVSNKEIIQELQRRFPYATTIDAPWRAGDVMHTLANISAAKINLGYTPVISFWDGVEKTIEWAMSSQLFFDHKGSK